MVIYLCPPLWPELLGETPQDNRVKNIPYITVVEDDFAPRAALAVDGNVESSDGSEIAISYRIPDGFSRYVFILSEPLGKITSHCKHLGFESDNRTVVLLMRELRAVITSRRARWLV